MRKTDHQLQQTLYMTVWQKTDAKNPYSPENTGMTLVPVKTFEPYVSSTPTSCQMKRPPEPGLRLASPRGEGPIGNPASGPSIFHWPALVRPRPRTEPDLPMEFFTISMLNGLSYGLLLFMLSSGLTLIFSMMGVLNFAHASFYMLGAYVGYTIAELVGFWPAPGAGAAGGRRLGALFERFCLRRVHKFGHVPELLITFGLSYVLLELVQLIWGRTAVEFRPPEALQGPVHVGQLVHRRPAAGGWGAAPAEMCSRRRCRRAHRLLAVPGHTRLHDVGRAADAGGAVADADPHAHRPGDPGALTHPRWSRRWATTCRVSSCWCSAPAPALAGLAGVIGGSTFVTEPAMAPPWAR
jgi:branched-chain amino acid transport system permease protein